MASNLRLTVDVGATMSRSRQDLLVARGKRDRSILELGNQCLVYNPSGVTGA